jgi:hypothetical protein
MNGSNHLAESDARPMPCPVDLRKLQESTDFDVVEWYRGLLDFNATAGFFEEASGSDGASSSSHARWRKKADANFDN